MAHLEVIGMEAYEMLDDSGAAFKLIQPDDDRIRFEASNYPGQFIITGDNGAVILAKDPPLFQSTFAWKKQ